MPCKRLKRAALLCLTVTFCSSSVGCSARPETTVLMPPESLMAECHEPTPPSGMNEGIDVRGYAIAVTRYTIDLRERLSECNADKRAMQQWVLRMRRFSDD